MRLPSTCWLDLVFSESSSCWHSTARRSWYWSCHCPAQNYEGFCPFIIQLDKTRSEKNIYNSNVDRVVPNSLFLITIKWGRGEGFTSTSGLCERRLEMRRLLICLFSSWDFMSSSWIIKFLVGLFRWWTSFRACFSTSLKNIYICRHFKLKMAVTALYSYLSSAWVLTSGSGWGLLAAAAIPMEATALILQAK